jgi:hypothetical protein
VDVVRRFDWSREVLERSLVDDEVERVSLERQRRHLALAEVDADLLSDLLLLAHAEGCCVVGYTVLRRFLGVGFRGWG